MDSMRQRLTRRQFIKGATTAIAASQILSEKPFFYGSLAHAAEEADLVIAKRGHLPSFSRLQWLP